MHSINHINSTFKVTKKESNTNGFLLPNFLYERIKETAYEPVKKFYLQEHVPEFSDYKFKMHKNAFLNDKLTIQAQLVKQDDNGYWVNIFITKSKNRLNHQETIGSALFKFPLVKEAYRESKKAC